MKKKCKYQQSLVNQRHKIINSINIQEDNNIRCVLDDALSYRNKASEDGLEYEERDIKHILVNHIRHRKSNYENGLKRINSIGVQLDHRRKNNSSYYLYKNATLDRISNLYPFLEKECDQQKHRMNMIKIKKTLSA